MEIRKNKEGEEQQFTWLCDYTTGRVTFNEAPAVNKLILASFEFDVPVRFDTDSMVLTDFGNRIPTFSFVVQFPKTNLKEIVEEISEDAGLILQQDVDASALGGINVEGFLRSGSKTFREQMEELRVVHIFEGAERFGKLVFAPRNFSNVVAVSSGEIGAYENKPSDEPLQISTKYDMELPKRLTVSYLSKDNDYQTGSQTGYRQLTGAITEESMFCSQYAPDEWGKQLSEDGTCSPEADGHP